MHTLVFVGDVEEMAVIGDRDALHAWRAWELANELGCEGPRVYVGWERAAEVGRDGVPAAGIVLYQDALLVSAGDLPVTRCSSLP